VLQDQIDMHCTLLSPHLWWSRDAAQDAYRDLALPELQTLIARARYHGFPAIGWEAWLCQAFEVERQRDWPVAPLTLTVDGGDPEDAYWLRADPVHLRPHRDQLLLADSNAFPLSPTEADALTGALNAHFEAEGLRFSAPRPDRWYLRLAADPEIATYPLDDVAGSLIDPCLPTGPNALRWHRIVNEAQMLLHAHAVNEAREERGDLTINGVWLWGGGRRATVPGRHFSALTSDDALAVALAANADIPVTPPAAHGESWLQAVAVHGSAARSLLVLTQLTGAARCGDLAAWRDALEELDRCWIAPLLAALKAGTMRQLVLVAPGRSGCQRFELNRAALFRFWRARRSLAAYAPGAVQ
jgi:hypothetical protein